MPSTHHTTTKEIIRDPYTERVLAVCYSLVKKRALARKQDFSEALGFRHHNQFNAIEARRANFPPKKAMVAEAQLLAKWGVNPKYLQGTDEEMYVWEPQPVKMAIGEGAAKLNFRDKRTKDKLLKENAALKARVEELEAKLGMAAEPSPKYKPDRKPDKKK